MASAALVPPIVVLAVKKSMVRAMSTHLRSQATVPVAMEWVRPVWGVFSAIAVLKMVSAGAMPPIVETGVNHALGLVENGRQM